MTLGPKKFGLSFDGTINLGHLAIVLTLVSWIWLEAQWQQKVQDGNRQLRMMLQAQNTKIENVGSAEKTDAAALAALASEEAALQSSSDTSIKDLQSRLADIDKQVEYILTTRGTGQRAPLQ